MLIFAVPLLHYLHTLTAQQVLKLSHNRIAQLQAGSFAGMRSLEQLHLNANQLHRLGDRLFADLRSLRRLDLSGNGLSHLGAAAFHGLDRLSVLNLADNKLSFRNSTLAAALHPDRLSSLAILDLSRNPLHSLPAAGSPFSSRLTESLPQAQRLYQPAQRNVQLLNMLLRRQAQNAYQLMPLAQPLQQRRAWPELKELHLAQCELHTVETDALDSLAALQTLQLSSNQISVG